VIDAASLQVARIINNEMDVLACYGTNGMTKEHIEAILQHTELQEVIFFFDGDQAGLEGVDKHSKQLAGLIPKAFGSSLIISKVETPEGEDINSLHIGHEVEVFHHLIENRTVLHLAEKQHFMPKGDLPKGGFFSSSEDNGEAAKEISRRLDSKEHIQGSLDVSSPEHIIYNTDAIRIHVWGGIESSNLARLKVSLHVEIRDGSYRNFRDEVNLYSYAQVKRITRHISEALEISTTYVSQVINQMTRELEDYRQRLTSNRTEEKQTRTVSLSTEQKQAALKVLTSPKLMRKTLDLIGEAGLVGQHKNGMLLFLLYLTRYFDEPLHAILFGKSGSGKTYTQTVIASCVPDEDIYITTGMTENTLYYSPKGFWQHKVLMIEDLEGVYQAFLPLRELMSKQEISKFTTDKDSRGNNVQVILKVEGPICVSGATTKEWIYEDNANRSFLILIGENKNQEELVMNYQRKKFAGLINESTQKAAQELLKNMQRLLRKDIKVVNPYAEQLILPDKVFKKLRTNSHYLELIKVITFYNQYNKEVKTNERGEKYIETGIEDIRWANRLAKENLLPPNPTQKDYIEGSRLLEEKYYPLPEISDESELRAYYDAHREELGIPAAARVSEIQFRFPKDADQAAKTAVFERAQDALRRLNNGEPFADVALDVSEHPKVKETSGDLGFLDRTTWSKWLINALDGVSVGGHTGVIESPIGYEILKITDERDAIIPSFSDVRDDVLHRLQLERQGQKRRIYVKGLASQTKIVVLLEELQDEFSGGIFP